MCVPPHLLVVEVFLPPVLPPLLAQDDSVVRRRTIRVDKITTLHNLRILALMRNINNFNDKLYLKKTLSAYCYAIHHKVLPFNLTMRHLV